MSDNMDKDSIDDEDQDNGVLRDPGYDLGNLAGDGENDDFDPEPTDDELSDIDADADEEDWIDEEIESREAGDWADLNDDFEDDEDSDDDNDAP